nr:zinc finger, CCHC-type [Tanacetum cinerariifolium]
ILLSIEDKLNYLEQPIPPAPVVPAEQELLHTTRDFHSCKQKEGQSVSSYVLKMKGYIDNLERLGHPVTLGLGVSLILIGLRKEFDGFVQNYNMHSLGKTINELHAMLKLHEQTLPKNNTLALHAIRATKVQKVNKHKKSHPQMASRGQNNGKGKNKQAYAPKPKIPLPPKKEDPEKKSICHECGKTGHWKGIVLKYPKETMRYSFYYPPENKVLVAQNVEFLENSLIIQEASGSLKYLEIIQREDTHPSIDTSLNHEEDDLEIDEPQSDIVPIRRSIKTRHALDRIDYKETFSLVVDIRAIRILIAIAAYYDYEIWQMDVKTAFLNGYLNDEVYMEQPEGASTPAKLKRMQNVPNASAVGSIMYAVRCTRPDVAFAQNVTSRFQQNPELKVSCYTDAVYLTNADDLKSQTGYVFVLYGGAVDWKSAKQSIFATSSAEAEYIAAFDASKEAVWVRKFIS